MRSKKAMTNVLMSFLSQIITVICGLIVPRLIIGTFGSSVNGAIASITQFLGYIVLLEAGVGGVIRAALYKPLAENDTQAISSIYKASKNFFRIIAYIFIAYLLVLACIFPFIVPGFDYTFLFLLVLVLGVSTIVQYYFGVTNQVLLQADQRQYIYTICQIAAIIINSMLVVLLIKLGSGILLIKLVASVIFIMNPIILTHYVKKRYKIINKCEVNNKAIKQRWDGLGQHIAFLLRTNIDIALITIFTNVKEVSVYSVYYMVIAGIERLLTTVFSGTEAAFGNMLAKNEIENINKNLDMFDYICFSLTMVLFICTAVLIVPFVSIYTKGITDANYIRPVFAYTLTAASALYCLRVPYAMIVNAAGHYRQTRNGAFAEALINAVLSIIFVNIWGIVGVAAGTLCALAFRTVQYVVYISKNIVYRSIYKFIKKCIVFSLTAFLVVLISSLIRTRIITYFDWFIYAIIIGSISFILIVFVGLAFFKKDIKNLLIFLKNAIKT